MTYNISMNFYEVWVRSSRYHGQTALTYAHERSLPVGQIVSVPLQRDDVLGFISAKVAKPRFATKPIVTVHNLPPLPPPIIKLGIWLQAYYPAPLGLVAQQLLPASLLAKPNTLNTKVIQSKAIKLPVLTDEQQAAVTQIDQPDTFVLHGKTGSGKTRVYIELARSTVASGRSAIVLTPEISLTSQLAEHFRQTFGEQVTLLHSNLSPKDRRDVWLGILQSSQPLVVVGPRSALFSPLKNVGLIVLDESHEPAYKQEQAPHYRTGRVAARLRELHRATLVLGSATPSIDDYFLAEQRHKPIIKLTELATTTPGSKPSAAAITVIDLKDHSLFARSNYLSQPLIDATQAALGRGEQTLLYLNRRGTARVIVCENCGWQAMCPHCDLPLTYHGDTHELRCHVCGFHGPAPAACPDCGQPAIIYKTIGTKAIVDEVGRLFPGARARRFDTDNQKADRFEQHYQAVARGDVDILIGTQLLAKGLDLPSLSVVGVLLADTSLQMPDFSATERTFQLLSQVLGRVGRGHVAGQAFVQTYQPDSPVIKAAVTGNWNDFYALELAERQQFNFPPFVHLLKLSVRRATAKSAEKAALELAQALAQHQVTIEGPAPSFHEKLAGKYQYQLVIKARQRSELLKIIAALPANWSYDIDPVDLM